MNKSKYGPMSHRFGDTVMYSLKVAKFPTRVGFKVPLGAANDTGVILV